jgi:hypothetical protein
MNIKSRTPAVSLLAGVFLFGAQAVNAQTTASPPPATAIRPAKEPQAQSSVPNNAPPATTTQTTGEAPRDPAIKQMNEKEKGKVERGGK